MSFEDSVRLFEGTRYEEEDTSSTTPRELRGWYSYAIAAEVFAVVGVGTCAQLCVFLMRVCSGHMLLYRDQRDVYSNRE